MNNSCIEHFISYFVTYLVGPDVRPSDSYIECYICVGLLQYASQKIFIFVIFVYTGLGAWSVVSFRGRGARLWRHPGSA